MFHKIETVEVYFPNGGRSFYKVGKALEIPTREEGIYAKTDIVVTKISVSKLFGFVTVHLSNNEKLHHFGVGFATTTGSTSAEFDFAVQRKMKQIEEDSKRI